MDVRGYDEIVRVGSVLRCGGVLARAAWRQRRRVRAMRVRARVLGSLVGAPHLVVTFAAGDVVVVDLDVFPRYETGRAGGALGPEVEGPGPGDVGSVETESARDRA